MLTEGSGLGTHKEPPVATKSIIAANSPTSQQFVRQKSDRSRLTSNCSSEFSTDEDDSNHDTSSLSSHYIHSQKHHHHQSPFSSIREKNVRSPAGVGPEFVASIVDLVSGQNASILSYTTNHSMTESNQISWQFVKLGDLMIIPIPEGVQQQKGFKEGLVALLEHGEDDLGCTRAIAALERERADRDVMTRLFMFLGFAVIPFNSIPSYLAAKADKFLFLLMNFASEDDDEEEF